LQTSQQVAQRRASVRMGRSRSGAYMGLRTLDGLAGRHAEGLAEQAVEMALTGETPTHRHVADALRPIAAFGQFLPAAVETRVADIGGHTAERLEQPIKLCARTGKAMTEQFGRERLGKVLRDVGA